MKEFEEEDVIEQILEDKSSEKDLLFAEWLVCSEENKREYLFFKVLWYYRKVYRPNKEEISLALNRLNENIDGRERKGQSAHWRKIEIQVVKYAAAILAFALISYAIYQYRQGAPLGKTDYVTLQVSSSDSIRHVKLEDGSILTVNKNSSVRYPAHFSSDKRIVYLDGEAYFDVHHESSRPFIVQSRTIKVKVLGTAFNVYSSSANPVAVTTLVRGKVLVQDSKNHNLAVLNPNQQVRYNDQNKTCTVSRVNPAYYTYWLKGELIFNRETLKNIFSRLETIYKIRIYNKSGIENKYHLVLNNRYTVDSVFQMIRYIAPVDYKIENGKVYVYKKKGGND